MSLIREVVRYLRHGRTDFHEELREKETEADKAYQGSLQSAVDVTTEAGKIYRTADFIRAVMKGDEGHHGH